MHTSSRDDDFIPTLCKMSPMSDSSFKRLEQCVTTLESLELSSDGLEEIDGILSAR
jgi:hypothetical protein